MQIKTCTKCHCEYPATVEYFYRNSKSADGLRCECKQCQQKQYAKYYIEKHKEEREVQLRTEKDLEQRNVKICTKCGKEYPKTSEYFHNRKDTKDGLSFWCKNCASISAAKYRNNEYENLVKRIKEQNEKRKLDSEYSKQRAEYDRQYYLMNKEKKSQYNKERYLTLDKDKVRAYQKKWNKENKEYIDKRNKAYRERTKEERKAYDRKRYKENKLSRLTSNAICRSLKGNKAGQHWEDLVPYNLEQLRQHLESQFTPEMNWNNYGTYWEVDHIIPQSLFSFTTYQDEQFQICWSLTNLRPLTVVENRSRPKDGSDISDDIRQKILKGVNKL